MKEPGENLLFHEFKDESFSRPPLLPNQHTSLSILFLCVTRMKKCVSCWLHAAHTLCNVKTIHHVRGTAAEHMFLPSSKPKLMSTLELHSVSLEPLWGGGGQCQLHKMYGRIFETQDRRSIENLEELWTIIYHLQARFRPELLKTTKTLERSAQAGLVVGGVMTYRGSRTEKEQPPDACA